MDEDALFAVLAALGGLLSASASRTAQEWAETLGGVTDVTEAGEEYANRAAYIAGWSHMVRAAARGPGKSHQHWGRDGPAPARSHSGVFGLANCTPMCAWHRSRIEPALDAPSPSSASSSAPTGVPCTSPASSISPPPNWLR